MLLLGSVVKNICTLDRVKITDNTDITPPVVAK